MENHKKRGRTLTFLCLMPILTAASQMAKVPRFATVTEGSKKEKKRNPKSVFVKTKRTRQCLKSLSVFLFGGKKTTKKRRRS